MQEIGDIHPVSGKSFGKTKKVAKKKAKSCVYIYDRMFVNILEGLKSW